jgi:hypothetical protein
MNSASLCSLAGRYDNPIPPRFLAPIDFLKIPALTSNSPAVGVVVCGWNLVAARVLLNPLPPPPLCPWQRQGRKVEEERLHLDGVGGRGLEGQSPLNSRDPIETLGTFQIAVGFQFQDEQMHSHTTNVAVGYRYLG